MGKRSTQGKGSGTLEGGVRRKPGRQRRTSIICQVPDCEVELLHAKGYYRRYRICIEHCNLPSIELEGATMRFCQQCGRFHTLDRFDGEKKSCRERLRSHNARRRSAAARARPRARFTNWGRGRAARVTMEDSAQEDGGEEGEEEESGDSAASGATHGQAARSPAQSTQDGAEGAAQAQVELSSPSPSPSPRAGARDAAEEQRASWGAVAGAGADAVLDLPPSLAFLRWHLSASDEAARAFCLPHPLARTDTANSSSTLLFQPTQLPMHGGQPWVSGVPRSPSPDPRRCGSPTLSAIVGLEDLDLPLPADSDDASQAFGAEVEPAGQQQLLVGSGWGEERAGGLHGGAPPGVLGTSGPLGATLLTDGLPSLGLCSGTGAGSWLPPPSPDLMRWLGGEEGGEEGAGLSGTSRPSSPAAQQLSCNVAAVEGGQRTMNPQPQPAAGGQLQVLQSPHDSPLSPVGPSAGWVPQHASTPATTTSAGNVEQGPPPASWAGCMCAASRSRSPGTSTALRGWSRDRLWPADAAGERATAGGALPVAAAARRQAQQLCSCPLAQPQVALQLSAGQHQQGGASCTVAAAPRPFHYTASASSYVAAAAAAAAREAKAVTTPVAAAGSVTYARQPDQGAGGPHLGSLPGTPLNASLAQQAQQHAGPPGAPGPRFFLDADGSVKLQLGLSSCDDSFGRGQAARAVPLPVAMLGPRASAHTCPARTLSVRGEGQHAEWVGGRADSRAVAGPSIGLVQPGIAGLSQWGRVYRGNPVGR